MIKFIITGAFMGLLLACNNGSGVKTSNKDSVAVNKTAAPVSIDEVMKGYFQLKDALANDDSKEAAAAAKEISNAWKELGDKNLDAAQKKAYDDANDDLEEHPEHIVHNTNKISHQREHFDYLSSAMYQLLKVFHTSHPLYVIKCPMYNDNKGAIWINESKDISNPYFGKQMPKCGVLNEEIK